MQLPILEPAPLVANHAEVFRELFENRCQFQYFKNYLTGLKVLPNKSMANIARCVVESSDKTNISLYFSGAQGLEEQVNDQRVKYRVKETKVVRLAKDNSMLLLDDTLCEHVRSLFEYVDHHYNHGDPTYWTFTLTVRIPGLGKVRLVISFENAEWTDTYALLVSHRVDWTAFRMISLRQSRLPIKTIGEAYRQQAHSLIEALILYASQQLEQGRPANDLFAYLFKIQLPST